MNETFRKIKKIEIKTRRLVEDYFSGKYQSIFKGQGMDFHGVRDYQPGDDIRTIDWNVTARLGRPYIKQFTEERQLTILILVDLSGSTKFGSGDNLKTEIGCEIASILAFSALKNQDKVGLMMFSDEVEKYLPPKKSKTYVMRIIREILYNKPKSPKTDIAKALRFVNEVQKRKAVIFLISDFIDYGFERLLAVTNRRHDLIAINISDEREKVMPSVGFVEFEDPESGKRIVVNTSSSYFTEKFPAEAKNEDSHLKEIFTKSKIDNIEINTLESYIKPLYAFFKTREQRK